MIYTLVKHNPLMISASKSTLGLKIFILFKPIFTQNLKNLHKKFCESPPCCLKLLKMWNRKDLTRNLFLPQAEISRTSTKICLRSPLRRILPSLSSKSNWKNFKKILTKRKVNNLRPEVTSSLRRTTDLPKPKLLSNRYVLCVNVFFSFSNS